MATDMMPVRIVRGARWKAALMCLALLPVLMLLDPVFRSDVALLCAIGFFALGGVFGLVVLIWPARLTLSDDGFEYFSLGRRWSVQWRSIETLMLWRNPAPHANQTLVGWSLLPQARKAGVLARVSRGLGVDGAVPGMWTMKPQHLLELMQTYHTAASRSTTSVLEQSPD